MSDADLDETDDDRKKRPGLPVDPGRLWLSVRSGWKLLPVGLLVGAALGLVVALLVIQRSYKSETILIWEPTHQVGPNDRDLATHAGVLKLPSTLSEVKNRMKVPISVETLTNLIEVWYDRSSNLVTVEASASSPAQAQKLTNTVVEVFLDHQKELGATRARETIAEIEADLATARTRLTTVRKNYDAFRSTHGISDFEAEATMAIEKAAEARAQKEQAAADATALEARVNKLDKLVRGQSRTSVQSSSTSNPAAQELASKRAELAAAEARYSADHPRLAALRAQISSLKQQARNSSAVVSSAVMGANPEYSAMSQTLSSTKAAQAEALQRERSYEEMAKGASRRVAELSAIEGEARSRRTDVEQAEKRVTDLEVQLAQARDAERSPPQEFRVLTPALLPENAEKSNRKIAMVGLTGLGLISVLAFLLIRPLRGGRVYTAREAAYWSGFPVVGSSAWPARHDMFFPFVDELNDSAALTRGTTLVIGAAGSEMPLARELSYWLGPAPNKAPGDREGVGSAMTRTRSSVPAAATDDIGTAATVSGTPVASAAPSAGNGGGPSQSSAPHGGGSQVALVRLDDGNAALARSDELLPVFYAWSGDIEGPSVRRAARMADRVLVVVASGSENMARLTTIGSRIGREDGVALLVIGLQDELLNLPDRAGDVAGFWR